MISANMGDLRERKGSEGKCLLKELLGNVYAYATFKKTESSLYLVTARETNILHPGVRRICLAAL